MCTVVRGASCRKRAECSKGKWLRMNSAIVVYMYSTIHYVIARYYHRHFHMLLRFEVRCMGKFSVYLLEIKIQITDIFDFYLLRLNQDLIKKCENVIQE